MLRCYCWIYLNLNSPQHNAWINLLPCVPSIEFILLGCYNKIKKYLIALTLEFTCVHIQQFAVQKILNKINTYTRVLYITLQTSIEYINDALYSTAFSVSGLQGKYEKKLPLGVQFVSSNKKLSFVGKFKEIDFASLLIYHWALKSEKIYLVTESLSQ